MGKENILGKKKKKDFQLINQDEIITLACPDFASPSETADGAGQPAGATSPSEQPRVLPANERARRRPGSDPGERKPSDLNLIEPLIPSPIYAKAVFRGPC